MRFGREYYQRYYFDPRTAVATRREMQARARLIVALQLANTLRKLECVPEPRSYLGEVDCVKCTAIGQ